METTFVAPETNIDSLEITPDTIEADDKESTPPATVDMLFADFIYLYSSNRSFQYSRTRFPLRHYKNRKPAAPIKKADWKFDRLYNKAELHIVVFDSEEALDEFDMSKSNRVVLEFLGFEKTVCANMFLKNNRANGNLPNLTLSACHCIMIRSSSSFTGVLPMILLSSENI